MKFKTLQFDESLSSPYPWKWKSTDPLNVKGTFRTKSGDSITVFFAYTQGGTYDLDFTSAKSGVFSTDDQDAFKVLATVVDVIRGFVKEFGHYAKWIEFTSVKDEDDGPDKRGAVYTRMLKKFLPRDWKVMSRKSADSTSFLLIKQVGSWEDPYKADV